MMALTGGGTEKNEDMYILRNAFVTEAGTVSRLLVNASGHINNSEFSAGATNIRAFHAGGEGRSRKAAFNPSKSLIAWTAKAGNSNSADWLQIARTTGQDFGKVLNIWEIGDSGNFRETGAFSADRVYMGLQWIDDDTLVFLMGRGPYDDPLGITTSANDMMVADCIPD